MDTKDAGRLGGLKGGKATGEAKRRGDSAYYKALRAKVKTYPVKIKDVNGDERIIRVTVPED